MASDGAERRRLVVFVCAHGAVRSRLAAALFNEAAPAGWWAISVGIEPQAELGRTALTLVAGTSVAAFLDPDPPRPLDTRTPADVLVAIDCEVPGADLWELDEKEVAHPMLDELQRRVQSLAADLAGHSL
jgi:hypothetical protein